MASIPVANGVKCEMIYQILSTRMENVYWVTRGAPATLAQLQALWTVLRDWESNSGKTMRGNGCTLQLISLTAMDAPGAPFWEAPVNPTIAGTNGAVMAPNVVSLSCKHTTGLQGRSFRGRSYWIGMSTAYFANADQVTAQTVVNITNIYNALRTVLAAAGWTFCVASLYSGVDGSGKAIPRANGILTPVTATSIEVGLDTQRHRKAPPVV